MIGSPDTNRNVSPLSSLRGALRPKSEGDAAIPDSPKIVFFGASDFSLPSLKAVCAFPKDLLVVTHTPTRVGRAQKLTPSPVTVEAKQRGLELLEVLNLRDSSLQARLKAFAAPVGVCASFGMIFPKDFISLFPRGIVNVHPSLLPRHRGPSPVQWTIHKGDIETGVTLLLIDEQVDHGSVFAQECVPVPPEISTPELMDSLAHLGAKLLERTLPRYLGGAITPQPQDEAAATRTPILTRDTGRINWATDDALQIKRNIRAFTPWPGVYSFWNSQRLKILGADFQTVIPSLPRGTVGSLRGRAEGSRQNQKPGTVTLLNTHLAIQTIHGLLSPTMLQLEGGNPMDVATFLHGHSTIAGAQLI